MPRDATIVYCRIGLPTARQLAKAGRMGFRSIMVTEDADLELPHWFLERWNWVRGTEKNGKVQLPAVSTMATSFYAEVNQQGIFQDLQTILRQTPQQELVVVLLHECGGLTRVSIKHDSITAKIPTDWEPVEYTGHDYCYGCSSD